MTQNKNITGQVAGGIRYFDVRTSFDPDRQDFFAVHGLYGARTIGIMVELANYLLRHPKEVVILDFNHLYNFNDSLHDEYMRQIKAVFSGGMLCQSTTAIDKLKLIDLWNRKCQVIAVYHGGNPSKDFWEGGTVQSPWPNTDSLTSLFSDLDTFLSQRDMTSLFVTQGLRTPAPKDIIRHLFSTLRKEIGEPTTKATVLWVQNLQGDMKTKLNIIEADVTSEFDFVKIIVSLNQ